MIEIWKDIKGYEGSYQVSNHGRVKSLRFRNCKRDLILKPILKKTGYYVISLQNKQFHIHKLVAEAFVFNPNGYNVVDHINTDTSDNRAENLRWCTVKENVNNPLSAQKRIDSIRRIFKGKRGIETAKFRAVYQFSLDGTFIKKWECMSDASRYYGIDSGAMTKVCQGKSKYAKGYVWRYTNKFDL